MIKEYKVVIGKEIVKVKITKKKMKNISIRIINSKEIRVGIPLALSYSRALLLLEGKFQWIEKKLLNLKTYEARDPNIFFLLGKEYTRDTLVKELNKGIKKPTEERKNVESLYIDYLSEIIHHLISQYSPVMGCRPKKVKLKSLKSAWGICYSSGTITFNSNLIKFPYEIIKYVVVHELGHLRHPNHSKEYWNFIAKFIPKPKEYRLWLKNESKKYI